MKKRMIVFLLILSLTFQMCGCNNVDNAEEIEQEQSQQPVIKEGDKVIKKQDMVLNLNWGYEPPDLDPQTANDQISFQVINAIYEGLVRLNPDGSIGYGLAEKYDISEDGLIYTFHLRDAVWSDKTPITADDFYYAWMRVLDPMMDEKYASKFYCIKNASLYNVGKISDPNKVGIKVVDEKTLQVELEEPSPYFLSLTAFITFMPAQKNAVINLGEDYAVDADKIICSGPFLVNEWVHDEKLTLIKNPNYWDESSVKLDIINGVMITESDNIEQMYNDEKLDIMGLGSHNINQYKDSIEYQTVSQDATVYFQFNCADKYFSSTEIRKAFSMAVDSEAYVKDIVKGLGKVAEGFTPPNITGNRHSFSNDRYSTLPAYNPESALILFEEGLNQVGETKEQFQEDVSLIISEGDGMLEMMKFFQNSWEANLGVKVKIKQLPLTSLLEKYKEGDYQITYVGWIGDYNDPLTFMDMWITNGGKNYTNWSNEQYDIYLDEASLSDQEIRINAMVEAEAILADEIPIYPIYHPNINFVQKENIKDIARFPVGSNIEFKWAYKVN